MNSIIKEWDGHMNSKFDLPVMLIALLIGSVAILHVFAQEDDGQTTASSARVGQPLLEPDNDDADLETFEIERSVDRPEAAELDVDEVAPTAPPVTAPPPRLNADAVLASARETPRRSLSLDDGHVDVAQGLSVFEAVASVCIQSDKRLHYDDPELLSEEALRQLRDTPSTFHAKDVYWEQALRYIIGPLHLDFIEDDRIIVLGSLEAIAVRRQALAQKTLTHNHRRIQVNFAGTEERPGTELYLALRDIRRQAGINVNFDWMDPEDRGLLPDITRRPVADELAEPVERRGKITTYSTPENQPVEWRIVMREVLAPSGYDFIEVNGVVRVLKQDAVAKWHADQLAAIPMVSKLARVHHINPVQLNERLRAMGAFRHPQASVQVVHGWDSTSKGVGIARHSTPPAVMVRDIEENIENVLEKIAKLDTRDRQIMIEARILDLGKNSSRELGVMFDQFGGGARVDTRYDQSHARGRDRAWRQTSDSMYGTEQFHRQDRVRPEDDDAMNALTVSRIASEQRTRDAFRDSAWGSMYEVLLNPLQLRATWGMLQQAGDAKIVSQPVLVMPDHAESFIRVQTEMPYVNLQTEYQQESGATIQSYEWESLNVGIDLRVIPEITSDGKSVRLSVLPKVTDSVGFVTAPDGSQRPVLDVRELDTRVTVASGHTLLMGGLIRSTGGKSERKIPFLGDIPLLGRLFRWNSSDEDRRNLVMLITPTILDDDEPDSGYERPAMKVSDPALSGLGRYSAEGEEPAHFPVSVTVAKAADDDSLPISDSDEETSEE
jgi:Flp pilus assembly secretin CpaC